MLSRPSSAGGVVGLRERRWPSDAVWPVRVVVFGGYSPRTTADAVTRLDQHPIYAFPGGWCGSSVRRRVRSRRPHGRRHHPDTHLVKTASKTAVNLMSRSWIRNLNRWASIPEVHEQVAGLLGPPPAGGMGGDPRMCTRRWPARSRTRRTGGAGRPCRRGRSRPRGSRLLGGQELFQVGPVRRGAGSRPAALRSSRRWRRDRVAEADQLALDPSVSPAGIVPGHASASARR